MSKINTSRRVLQIASYCAVLALATGCATNTFIQGQNTSDTIAWDSGKPGTPSSIDCLDNTGPRALLAGVTGFKEPSSNLDKFIARLDVICIEYANQEVLGYVQTQNTDIVTLTSTTDFRTGAGEVPVRIASSTVPIGMVVVHGRKSYVKNLYMLFGTIVTDDNGVRSISGYGTNLLENTTILGPTIPDYTTAQLIGVAGPITRRPNFERLECDSPQVMTGLTIDIDANNNKIRRVQATCAPLVFFGGES